MRLTRLLPISRIVCLAALLAGCQTPPADSAEAQATTTAPLAPTANTAGSQPKPSPGVGTLPKLPTPGKTAMESDELIRLERSGCGFRCPAYQLSVYADGRVRFVSRAHTAVEGEQRSQIDAERLQALLARLRAELPAVAGRYVPGSKDCGQMRTDQPTVRLAVRNGDGLIESQHYTGCEGAPRQLAELENHVDAATGSAAWISRKPIL